MVFLAKRKTIKMKLGVDVQTDSNCKALGSWATAKQNGAGIKFDNEKQKIDVPCCRMQWILGCRATTRRYDTGTLMRRIYEIPGAY